MRNSGTQHEGQTATKMLLFEPLRPFVCFCQVFGLIPFFIENENSPEKNFKKFSFSLCHPISWWFFFLFTVQLVIPVWDIYSVLDLIHQTQVPPMFIGFVLHEHVFLIVLVVMTRYAISKYPCIRRAICLLRKVSSELAIENVPQEFLTGLKIRVALGIFTSVVCTAAIMLSNVGLFPAKMKHDGMIFAVLVLINRSFMVMMLMSSFLLVYFCYYIVACYIRLVALDMKRPFQLSPVEKITGAKAKTIAWMQVNDTKTVLSWKYKWKQSKRMFGDLCKALSELNEVFSLPSLVFLTLRLISSAFSLYVTIYGSLRTNNAFIQALAPACAVNFTTGFLSILVVLKGIETPIIEFKHLRQRIFSVLNEEPDIQMDDEFEALSFLQHITEGRARLSAAGLFYVGLNLLPSLTASIITYLIILLQTRLV